MEITVAGVDTLTDLTRALAGGGMDAETALRPFIALYSEALQRALPRRSGDLRASMRVRLGATEALVEVTAPYALYVLLGVRAQWMRWLEGKTVSFIARDGERVTRRLVRVGVWGGRSHWWRPATPPDDYFRRALEDPRVVRALADLAERGTPVQIAYTIPAKG